MRPWLALLLAVAAGACGREQPTDPQAERPAPAADGASRRERGSGGGRGQGRGAWAPPAPGAAEPRVEPSPWDVARRTIEQAFPKQEADAWKERIRTRVGVRDAEAARIRLAWMRLLAAEYASPGGKEGAAAFAELADLERRSFEADLALALVLLDPADPAARARLAQARLADSLLVDPLTSASLKLAQVALVRGEAAADPAMRFRLAVSSVPVDAAVGRARNAVEGWKTLDPAGATPVKEAVLAAYGAIVAFQQAKLGALAFAPPSSPSAPGRPTGNWNLDDFLPPLLPAGTQGGPSGALTRAILDAGRAGGQGWGPGGARGGWSGGVRGRGGGGGPGGGPGGGAGAVPGGGSGGEPGGGAGAGPGGGPGDGQGWGSGGGRGWGAGGGTGGGPGIGQGADGSGGLGGEPGE